MSHCQPKCYYITLAGEPTGLYQYEKTAAGWRWLYPLDASGQRLPVTTPATIAALDALRIPANERGCDGLSVDTPAGADIANNTAAWAFPVQYVHSFTVTREGAGAVVVTTASGVVTLHRNGSRTWSGADGGLLDVSAVRIATGANSNADVIWEN